MFHFATIKFQSEHADRLNDRPIKTMNSPTSNIRHATATEQKHKSNCSATQWFAAGVLPVAAAEVVAAVVQASCEAVGKIVRRL